MLERLYQGARKALNGLEKEVSILETLHVECQATLARMEKRDPGLRKLLHESAGYAVFPSVGTAALVLGGSFGMGEVFEGESLVGYAAVARATVGVQVGGETAAQVVAFDSAAALRRFKGGKAALAAEAAAVLVKKGAAAEAGYEKGVKVFVMPKGGMMLGLSVGGQKFFFKPALLGRAAEAGDGKAKGKSMASKRMKGSKRSGAARKSGAAKGKRKP